MTKVLSEENSKDEKWGFATLTCSRCGRVVRREVKMPVYSCLAITSCPACNGFMYLAR